MASSDYYETFLHEKTTGAGVNVGASGEFLKVSSLSFGFFFFFSCGWFDQNLPGRDYEFDQNLPSKDYDANEDDKDNPADDWSRVGHPWKKYENSE